ncbi:hypothetical protein BBJ28_00008062 [Nothophytophthora sp. Chile5]|nr:hypothetical protein BBJ28_00008062 [Nothophytophthora sp. Chile5]
MAPASTPEPSPAQPPAAATSVRVPSGAYSYRHFVGGAVGGMTAALITSPLEVVKTRLQIRGGSGSFGTQTTFGVMRSIGKSESVLGLWRGITPTLIGVMPARAVYFGAYSTFKEKFSGYGLTGRVYNFASAAGAGSISATLCCPIWVVKTRLQLMPAHAMANVARQNVLSVGFAEVSTAATKHRPQFSSIRQVATDMYRKEGPRAFFRGLSASYWGISESAIQFAMYEECKDHIEEPTNLKYFLAAGGCKLLASMLTYPHEVRPYLAECCRMDGRMNLLRLAAVCDAGGSNENAGSARAAGLEGAKLNVFGWVCRVWTSRYRSMIQSVIKIYKEEGRRGLYGGMPAHLMRVVPNAAILFLVVELVANKE